MNPIIQPFFVKPAYLICEIQTKLSKTIGLIALLSLDAFEDKRVFLHEKILPDLVTELTQSFQHTSIQQKPVLLAYKNPSLKPSLIEELAQQRASFELFNDEQYRFWVIDSPELIVQITQYYQQINPYYLADGHHRVKGLSNYLQSRAQQKRYILSYIVSDQHLHLNGFHKLIYQTGMTDERFLFALTDYFELHPHLDNDDISSTLSIYCNQKWYRLDPKVPHPLQFNIPACYVDYFIFQKVLDFKFESQIEKNILSLNHHVPLNALEIQVNTGLYQCALYIPSLSWDAFFLLVQQQYLLSPNSTYFEPKFSENVISLNLDAPFLVETCIPEAVLA